MCLIPIILTIYFVNISQTFYRPLAIGALVTTATACTLCIAQLALDYKNSDVDLTQCKSNHSNDATFTPHYPKHEVEGYFMAFGSIMFAFGGASTFPTIQADMKDKSKFKFAAYIAMAGIYFCLYHH